MGCDARANCQAKLICPMAVDAPVRPGPKPRLLRQGRNSVDGDFRRINADIETLAGARLTQPTVNQSTTAVRVHTGALERPHICELFIAIKYVPH